MNQTDLGQSLASDLSGSDVLSAYEEAKRNGFVYNPYSLEDDEAYEPDDIEKFFLNADGSPRL